MGNLGGVVETIVKANTYIAAIAGTENAAEALEKLTAAGITAEADGESVVIDGGEVTAEPFEGVNQIGDHFFLWCFNTPDGELAFCAPRSKQGSCPPHGS